jgi:hypothetical protein
VTAAEGRPVLRGLRIADSPERWRAIGFTVNDAELLLGGVTVELRPGADGETGIVSWTLADIEPVDSIDGLATRVSDASPVSGPSNHDNGAVAIDHVVITTPDFARSADALAAVGLELRRVREAPGGVRQGFRRLGQAILELVEIPDPPDPGAPARFWGLVVIVRDLEALGERLGAVLRPAKDAVQPGRRIATVRRSAGLGPAVAFMTPEP